MEETGWDKFLNYAAPELYNRLKKAEAQPIVQKLQDYQNQGWGSDPSFTGKEWTDGLLSMPQYTYGPSTYQGAATDEGPSQGNIVVGLPTSETLPPEIDKNNPNVLKAISGFASQAQNEKSYADQLQRMGAPVQDAGSISRFALGPQMLPHLTALENAPAVFSPPEYDTETPAKQAFLERLPEVYAAPVAEQPTILARIAKDTGVPPEFGFNALKQVQSQNVVEKAPAAPHTIDKPIGQGRLQKFQFDPSSPDKDKFVIPIGVPFTPVAQQRLDAPKTLGLNINGLNQDENAALSRAIDNGLDPYKINSRTAKIYATQEMLNPGRKWNELGATASFERNAGVMNTKALLNAIDPILSGLEKAGEALGNSRIPGANRIMNWAKEQTGDTDIVAFNNLRDDAVAEVERGLLGSGVLSDSKYNRAIKNINSAQTLPQLKTAIKNTKFVIAARLEALQKGPSAKPVQIAPAGTKAKLANGKIVTSDGKGGWQ